MKIHLRDSGTTNLLSFAGENPSPCRERGKAAFTIAELLIALAILGVIAVFTIPKILESGSNAKWNAVAKDAMTMIDGAYVDYKIENVPPANMTPGTLAPYLNYVREETTGLIDGSPAWDPSYACSSVGFKCLRLHNGGILTSWDFGNFGGSENTNIVWFNIDPDGQYTGIRDSIWVGLYYSGRVTSMGEVEPNTFDSWGLPYSPNPASNPAWFQWDGK